MREIKNENIWLERVSNNSPKNRIFEKVNIFDVVMLANKMDAKYNPYQLGSPNVLVSLALSAKLSKYEIKNNNPRDNVDTEINCLTLMATEVSIQGDLNLKRIKKNGHQ